MRRFMFLVGFTVTAYEALVFKWMWIWFVAPTFGLPVLSFWIALGILLTIEIATAKTPNVVLMEYQLTRLSDERVVYLGFVKVMTAVMNATFIFMLGYIILLLS